MNSINSLTNNGLSASTFSADFNSIAKGGCVIPKPLSFPTAAQTVAAGGEAGAMQDIYKVLVQLVQSVMEIVNKLVTALSGGVQNNVASTDAGATTAAANSTTSATTATKDAATSEVTKKDEDKNKTKDMLKGIFDIGTSILSLFLPAGGKVMKGAKAIFSKITKAIGKFF